MFDAGDSELLYSERRFGWMQVSAENLNVREEAESLPAGWVSKLSTESGIGTALGLVLSRIEILLWFFGF